MSWKLDQNAYNNRSESQHEMYSSNSNSRRFKDYYEDHDENYSNPGRKNEVNDRQGRSKSLKFNHAYHSDSDEDEYKSFGSKGYRNYSKKKIFGGLFGGSSRPKILPPYQTVMLRVRTQCAECVRKVKTAIAHLDGVESITVDMNQKKLTIKGYVDSQGVLRKASKTGKSVELVNSKGSGGGNFTSYEQPLYGNNIDDRFRSNSDSYQKSNSNKQNQGSSLSNYQQSGAGDKSRKSFGNEQNSKGVKFNVTPEYGRQYNEDDYNEKSFTSKPKKSSEYNDRYGSPDARRSNSEQRQNLNGHKSRQESDSFQRPNCFEKSSQKRSDYERQSEDRFRPNLVYPASRDDGSYIFSDENANNCSVM